jgi:hypothetical protein
MGPLVLMLLSLQRLSCVSGRPRMLWTKMTSESASQVLGSKRTQVRKRLFLSGSSLYKYMVRKEGLNVKGSSLHVLVPRGQCGLRGRALAIAVGAKEPVPRHQLNKRIQMSEALNKGARHLIAIIALEVRVMQVMEVTAAAYIPDAAMANLCTCATRTCSEVC